MAFFCDGVSYMTTRPAFDAGLRGYFRIGPTRTEVDRAAEEFMRARALAMRLLGDSLIFNPANDDTWHKDKNGR